MQKNILENCCEFMWHKERFKGEFGALETRPKIYIVNDSKDKGKVESFKSIFGLNFYTISIFNNSKHGNDFSRKFEWKTTCALHEASESNRVVCWNWHKGNERKKPTGRSFKSCSLPSTVIKQIAFCVFRLFLALIFNLFPSRKRFESKAQNNFFFRVNYSHRKFATRQRYDK